ncbi:MAG: 3-methyl-2-oxobutanoate hydroxymethyltransferase [Helicobacteraceae bacterium]|jgi:3-methyl-2-oxobutanoate hydroxymethyltransferase|nr:3-methyl-2-oxobutanoate hydroxymethyltransferase [Helicobacteraceae bacterium]
MSKITIETIKAAKNTRKLVTITAYDALFARLIAPEADIVLVGDSLAMSFGGHNDTIAITLDEMIYHAKAVCRGASDSFVVFDMPFGSCANAKTALESAIRVYKETDASAVKIEGGVEKADVIKRLTTNAIAVMGHIGLTPQFARQSGGFRVQGKDEAAIAKLIDDAKAVEDAGAFAIVLEGVKANAVPRVVQSVKIPVIGIGASADCDGQVLVWSDLLGFFEAFKPKFVRRYLEGATLAKEAIAKFAADVRSGAFPSAAEFYI